TLMQKKIAPNTLSRMILQPINQGFELKLIGLGFTRPTKNISLKLIGLGFTRPTIFMMRLSKRRNQVREYKMGIQNCGIALNLFAI
ncbi:MAG: hypothetical protein NT086_03155, partial [Proteobacteria bacterium]|nr:hypothetical protein [Pseudomonadota bacterium]